MQKQKLTKYYQYGRVMKMSNTWDEIMKNSPTMKNLVENKITEEVVKVKQGYEQQLDEKQQQIDTLSLQMLDMMGV